MGNWAFGFNSYGWGQKWIDTSPGKRWGIEWWKEEQPPIPNPKWPMRCYWQGDRDLPTFWAYLQQEETRLKSVHKINFAKLQGLFPVLDWEITEEEFFFAVRVRTNYGGSGSGASPVSLEDKHFEDMKQWLSAKAWKREKKAQLSATYPFLYFAPDSSPNSVETSPAMQAFIGAGTQWQVFTLVDDEWGKRCGTAIGFFFEMPMDSDIIRKLQGLNRESEKAQQEGWFFCSVCQIAKPRSEYGYYYFAETRCQDCLDPAWEKRAREETYN